MERRRELTDGFGLLLAGLGLVEVKGQVTHFFVGLLTVDHQFFYRTQEARIIFKAGKNRDGYFDCANLCKQTERAIELFEDNFPGTAVAAFGFNNAPGHQK